jgi:hypothetical protein
MPHKSEEKNNVTDHFQSRMSFSSEALLQQALANLLIRMPEVTGVQILQGNLELGKDIIFNTPGAFGESILCACVVKNTRITGDASKPGGARTIYHQAEQAFDTAHTNNLGTDIKVERVYVITPYDLPPSTIASISGKLRERAGQIVFIGGSMLFDLFKKHWPDFFADEATLIEQHLRETTKLYTDNNPLPALAFNYSLGSVSTNLMSVYVTQGFHRELRTYKMGRLLISSLPDPQILERKMDRETIQRIRNTFLQFDSALNYLHRWGFCPSSLDLTELKKSSDEFLEELKSEWTKSLESFRSQHSQAMVNPAVPLMNPEKLENMLKRLINDRRSNLTLLEDNLSNLNRILPSSELKGVAALSSKNYLSACYINECARAAPEGLFTDGHSSVVITFPKDILDKWENTLFIVGAPGFGKTSFCRWQALQDAEKFTLGKSNILPIYFPLHQLSGRTIDTFENTFLKTLGKSALIPAGKTDAPPRVRLYLDGLDEVASSERRKEVIDLAKEGSKKYPNYQIVITSRDYIYDNWLDWIPKVYLSEFTDPEVEEFINRWFGQNTEINKTFSTQLEKQPALYNLLRTPLLATLIVMVFQQTGRLPENKTRLYEIFTDLLSGGWDIAKSINRGSKYGQRIKIIILCALAGNLHARRHREFGDAELKTAIESSLLGLALKDWESLRDELVGDGLIGRSGGIFYFSHLSFQEFLAAKAFMGSPHPTRIQSALKVYLHGDDWWKEVLKFYVSLSSNPQVISSWLAHQVRDLKIAYFKKLSTDHILTLLASIVESFPAFPVEELAEKMRETLNYDETLSYLKGVQQKVFP